MRESERAFGFESNECELAASAQSIIHTQISRNGKRQLGVDCEYEEAVEDSWRALKVFGGTNFSVVACAASCSAVVERGPHWKLVTRRRNWGNLAILIKWPATGK
jgi:hypothetical protein